MDITQGRYNILYHTYRAHKSFKYWTVICIRKRKESRKKKGRDKKGREILFTSEYIIIFKKK